MFQEEEAEAYAKAQTLSPVTAYTLPLCSSWPGLSSIQQTFYGRDRVQFKSGHLSVQHRPDTNVKIRHLCTEH